MQTLTFTCKVITPLFLGGADGDVPELRAPSIKGGMRYWWRAMHANLPMADMRQREARIFGGASPGQRSKVLIRIPDAGKRRETPKESPLPHRENSFTKKAFKPGAQFYVRLSLMAQQKLYEKSSLEAVDQLKNHFILTCLLGGFGKRVRRGMGSIGITNIQKGEGSETYQMPNTLDGIYELLTSLMPDYFKQENGCIKSLFNTTEAYPYIEEVYLGEPRNGGKLLTDIGKTTHKLKKRGKAYEASLGHAANKKRFASPLYVSTVECNEGLCPIITRLHTVPDSDHEDDVSPALQEEFISEIKNGTPPHKRQR